MNVKPCPFCGSIEIGVFPDDHGVICHVCGAWMPSRFSTDKERNHGALEMWNTRKEPSMKPKKGKGKGC